MPENERAPRITEGPDADGRSLTIFAPTTDNTKDPTPTAAEADAPMVLCRRCKHPLVRPMSVARRFGPTCWRRILDAARAGGVL